MRPAIEVTQADREAAASVAVLTEMRELILAGRADHHAEPFARHRIAGVKAGLEAAAGAAMRAVLAASMNAKVWDAISNIDPEECE